MQLGYAVFEVSDLAAWKTFMTDILGLQDVGGGRYRNDGHAWRFQLTEGHLDDLAVVGFEMDDDQLDHALTRLAARDVDVTELDPAERDVTRRYGFVDPAGIPVELTTGNALADTPFASDVVPHGFIADELGWGHIVLSTRTKDESVAFYQDVLGIKLSDHITCEFFGYDVDLSFFHVNPRHHTVAFGGPQRHRLNHFMIEAKTMDDVGLAFDRALKGGIRINQTLGRHPNDRMFSFYARTPSGFQFEFGWGGRLVDDPDWEPETYHAISEWGHHPPMMLAPPKKKA